VKIAFQHSGILPVKKYGGIERILFWHMKELVRLGHKVVLFGHPDSQVSKYGIELQESPKDINDLPRYLPKDTDIIHLTFNHTVNVSAPTLNNIQGNGQPGEVFSKNTVFVSKKHAENHNATCFIHNAIALEEYPFKAKDLSRFSDFLFLAKGSWKVKNLKQCKSLAKKMKRNLHVAGGQSWLPSKSVTSYGMVGGQEKLDIMNKCQALLFPVRWHEPFGIAIIEAMALGLPVFGSCYGSLPELINEDVGGVASDLAELERNILESEGKLDSLKIRQYVENKFSINRLTLDYLELYERMLAGEGLNTEAPTWRPDRAPLELLPF